MVSQDKLLIELYSRHQDGWHLTEAKGLGSKIRLQVLGVDVSMSAVYAKVRFGHL